MIEIPLRLRHRVRDANFSPTFHRYSADVGSARGVYISTCNSVTTTYTTWWFSAALLNPHTFTTRFHEQIHLGFPARAMAFLLSVTSCTVASFCGASFRQVYHESYNQLLGKYSDFSIQDNMGYRVKKKKKTHRDFHDWDANWADCLLWIFLCYPGLCWENDQKCASSHWLSF